MIQINSKIKSLQLQAFQKIFNLKVQTTLRKHSFTMTNHIPISQCKYCQSQHITTQTNLFGKHWGALICASCGKNLKWLPNPLITDEASQRKKLIDAALANGRVTGWESLFLRNIRPRRHLSPKQQEKFDQICTRHGLKIPACGAG